MPDEVEVSAPANAPSGPTRSTGEGRTLARHSVLAVFTTGLDTVGALAVSVLVGRLLGASPTGLLGYAGAAAGLLVAIFGFGLPAYLGQQVAVNRGTGARWQESARSVMSFYLWVSLPLAILALVAGRVLLGKEVGEMAVVVPAVITAFALAVTAMLVANLRALGDFRTALYLRLMVRVSSVVSILVVWRLGAGIAAYLSAVAFLNIVAALAAARVYRRLGGLPLWGWPSWDVLPHLKAALPFGAIVIIELAYFQIDVLFVKWFCGTAATGYYTVAYTFYRAPLVLSWALSVAFYPWVARVSAAGGETHTARSNLTLVVLAYSLLAAAALWWLGPWVLSVLFGPEFHPSAALLRVLALSLPLTSLNRLGTTSLKGTGRVRAAAIAAVVATVVAIGGNWIYVPAHGPVAAAWVTVATEAVLLVMVAALGGWRSGRLAAGRGAVA